MTGRGTAPGAALVAAALAVTGAATATGAGAATGAGGPPSGGRAAAGAVFATYSDADTVIEGGTVAPPRTHAPLASAALDLAGQGEAVGALAYNPYVEAPGLLNAFTGAGLPADELAGKSRAKVTGTPPEEADASLAGPGPDGDGPRVGTARARLGGRPGSEVVEAEAAVVGSGPDAAVRVEGARTEAAVRRDPGARSTARTVLFGVEVTGGLRIESLALSVTAEPDGTVTAQVRTVGATVAGQPVDLAGAGPAEPLAAAGIEVVAPAEIEERAGTDEPGATATGPRLALETPDGRRLEVTLGRVEAAAFQVAARAPRPASPAEPGAGPGPDPGRPAPAALPLRRP